MTGKTGSKRGEPQVFTHNIVFKKLVEGEEDRWAAHVAEIAQNSFTFTKGKSGNSNASRLAPRIFNRFENLPATGMRNNLSNFGHVDV